MAEGVRWELKDGLAEIVFDDATRAANVLDQATLAAFARCLDAIAVAEGVRAVVLVSAKPEVYIAGADLDAIKDLRDGSQAVGIVARVQALFSRLDGVRVPVVAAIHGACLGGGLELALACHWRVASDDPRTRLGLPEVQLGLIPGFGGSQRLPRLAGLATACDLILTGRTVDGDKARRLGVVDAVLPSEGFRARAGAYALAIADRTKGRYRVRAARPAHFADRLVLALPPLRDFVFSRVEKRVRAESKGFYPAPVKAIQAMREGLRRRLVEGLEIEASIVGPLVVSSEAKSLVRLFLLTERARKETALADPEATPERVTRAGVIGAGVMGSAIALELARKGIPVRLKDLDSESVRRGLERISADLDLGVAKGKTTRREAQRILARISPTTEMSGFAQSDIVIEAVAEEMGVKRDVLKVLEPGLKDTAIFATNTSALSVSELGLAAKRPGNVVGLHFFNPVRKMPLVEVARGKDSGERAVAMALRLAKDLGKTPVVVADTPGFLVNRILMPYLMEAVVWVEAGARVEDLDHAMVEFGLPMGPLELLDQVGIDIAHRAALTMARAFGERVVGTRLLEVMVARGALGRKSGAGFYVHRGRASANGMLSSYIREAGGRGGRLGLKRGVVQERLVVPMVNEAARCLDEGVVARAGDVDMASVLGFGFPPFRGGVLRFADALGLKDVLARLERLREVEGPRFAPSPLIMKLVRDGSNFARLDPL